MRATTALLLTGLCAATLAAPRAEAAPPRTKAAAVIAGRPTDVSAQERRRPRVRIYRETYDRGVVPSYFPGSNAVRDCSVTYMREFRPSGTVITPNMRCFWRQP